MYNASVTTSATAIYFCIVSILCRTVEMPPYCLGGSISLGSLNDYRLGTVNLNTVNSKFHLIRSYCEYLARILSFHV